VESGEGFLRGMLRCVVKGSKEKVGSILGFETRCSRS
jgi:hypothetical protein